MSEREGNTVRFENNEIIFEDLLTRMEGSTLILTFNRPEVRNAINWTMERELYTALYVADRLEEVKAVILNGAGEIFSAGHDLKQVRDDGGNMPMVDGEMWARQTTMLPSWNFKKPFIVAAHSFVGPFANGILLTADFIIAATGTKFSFEHARTSVGRPWGPYPLMFFHFPPRLSTSCGPWAGGWTPSRRCNSTMSSASWTDPSSTKSLSSGPSRSLSSILRDFSRPKRVCTK